MKRDTNIFKNRRGQLLEVGKSYCCECKKEKSISEFNKDKHSYYGMSKLCRSCSKIKAKIRYNENKGKYRNKDLLRKFGISLSEYNIIRDNQSSKCAICGKMEDRFKDKKVWIMACSAHDGRTGFPLGYDIHMQNINLRMSTNIEFNQIHISSLATEDLIILQNAITEKLKADFKKAEDRLK